MVDIDLLAKRIHAHNVDVGWWDNPDECIFQKLQLVSTEVAEATEGARKNLMDTHITYRKMEEVEYADAMIRIMDLGAKLNLEYQEERYVNSWASKFNSIGMQHLAINRQIIRMAETLVSVQMLEEEMSPSYPAAYHALEIDYSSIINTIINVAENREFFLFSAIYEKLLYNEERADHKRENRAEANGKKF